MMQKSEELKPGFCTNFFTYGHLGFEILKEPLGLLWSAINRIKYSINPHIYGLNPKKISCDHDDKIRITVLSHGAHGHPSNLLSIAKSLHKIGCENLYAFSISDQKDEPVPMKALAKKISKISRQVLEENKMAKKVHVTIVGHSLGGIAAVAVGTYQDTLFSNDVTIAKVITLGSRIKYIHNNFSWFCKDMKPFIQNLYKNYRNNPNKFKLITIWGYRDKIVPQKSVSVGDENYTVSASGHAGIIYNCKAIKIITESVRS